MKINERSSLMAGKWADQQVKAEERAQKERTRIAEREATKRQRAEEKTARETVRFRTSIASGGSGALGRATRGTISTFTGVAGMMGLAGGGAMVGSAVMSGLNLQRQAALLANSTSVGGKAGLSPAELISMARGTAMATGFGASNVMESMNVVAARGGPEAIRAFKKDLQDVAKTAIASGTSIEDMGAVYAAAFKAGVAPGKEMSQLMMDLVSQGKEGAVEFADLAQELAKLSGAGKSWGTGADMIRRASGLAQIAVESAVSPEESRTAVVDMVREFTQGPKIQALKNAGINIEGKGGKNRDPADLLSEIIDKAETKSIGKHGYKGQAALSEIFSGKSQEAIVRNLRETYLQGYKSEMMGRSYTGKEAVRQRIIDSSSSTMTEAQRNLEFQRVMATDMQKVAVAMEKFGASMDQVLPKITALIPTLSSVLDGFAKVVTWVADNPIKASLALLGANILRETTASIAGAAIGAGVKNAILAAVAGANGAPVGAPIPGAQGGAAGGAVGKVTAVAGSGVAGFGLGWAIGETMDAIGANTGQGAHAARIQAENLLNIDEKGNINGARQGATKEQLLAAAASVKQGEDVGKFGTHWYDYAGPIGIGAGAIRAMSEKSEVQGTMDPAKLQAALLAAAEKQAAAADKQAAAADKLNTVQLPNQSGTPTSKNPTGSGMK